MVKKSGSSNWKHEMDLSVNPALRSLGCLLGGGSKFMIEAAESSRAYCVVDRNKQLVRYFWHENSHGLQQLLDECRTHEFNTDAPSWSRLCKHVFHREFSEVKSGIKIHPFYQGLAEAKWHWHSCKAVPGYYENVSELDIKSAYAQSIYNQPSMYRESRFGCADDNGLIDTWRAVYPTFSKKLRLAMVGWLSSNRLSVLAPPEEGNFELVRKTMFKCYDGGVFNTIHHSLHELYTAMIDFAQVSPAHTPRMHTDSLWITGDIPDKKLAKLLDTIEARGYECSVKGHGSAVLFDLNCGILGGHIIGIPSHACKLFEEFKIKNPHIEWVQADVDKRVRHLPYKNERISLRQHREILAMMKES